MAIQFILGPCGSGKTTYIYEQMIASSRRKEHGTVIFMLPEQSNMAAEKEMVSRHPNQGTMDISILSFTRLAFKVFDELNVHTHDILDDYGKSILIMRLLKKHEKELSYYGSMVGKQGFVDEVKSIFSEFYQYQVTEEVLLQVIGTLSPDKSLYHKLTDLKLLLHAFEEAMEGSYMVAEQLLTLLKETAHDSRLLAGAEIYFDGYTGFTPVQYSVIEELMRLGCNLYFSFTMDADLFGDNGYSEHGLFALGKQSIDRLCKLAMDTGTVVLPHVGLRENYRARGKEGLLHLERQLFRFPVKTFPNKVDDIMILSAKNETEESVLIAGMIQDYVMNRGYRYSDFAIIAGGLQSGNHIWNRAMEMHNIPYFMDFSEPMVNNPVALIVNDVLEIFQSDFSYESVFALLKTGFFDMEKERIFQLENYVLKYGIRGYNRWSAPFRGGVKGLHAINETRAQFMEYLAPATDVLQKKEAVAKEYILAIYNFMSTNKMAEKLYRQSHSLEMEGELREAKAYAQVYDKFIAVLDKTMDILGEESIRRDALMEVLGTGICDMRLGMIPSTLDQVTIGDMERTRLHHIRILFVAGMNEGILPRNVDGTGILLDKDRRELKELDISLAADSREDVFLQQFYLYLQITQPSEKLILSCRREDAAGSPMRSSYFLERILKIFPGLSCVDMEELKSGLLPVSESSLVREFSEQLSEGRIKDASVYLALAHSNKKMLERILSGYFYHNNPGCLDQAIAEQLYGQHMIHSVSRLETYSGCAYQFFLQYGLGLKKREEYSIETNHIGTILHAVMEHFFTWVKEEGILLEQLSREACSQKVEALTREAAVEENETIFESSFRNRHQLEVLIRIAKRSVENLCRHLLQGEMKPAYFEMRFSPEEKLSYIDMALEEEARMELSGIVDRVDIRETEDAVYVNIIDYKSGAKDIDYIKMYEGRQLQLTVYMNVVLEMLKRKNPDKKVIPTGMYYYHIYDPIIEESDVDKLEQKRVESSRLTGLVNQEDACLQMLDKRTGLVAPVRYKKDGSFDSRNASLVTGEELQAVSDFVRHKMIDIGNDIVQGNIPMNPEKGETSSPCNLCDYKSVCRFEPGLGGNAYRIAPSLTKLEAKKKIMGKEDENA